MMLLPPSPLSYRTPGHRLWTDRMHLHRRKKKAPAAKKQRAPIEEEEEVDEDTRTYSFCRTRSLLTSYTTGRRRNLASRLDAIVKKPKSKSSGKKKRDGAQDDVSLPALQNDTGLMRVDRTLMR